MWFVICSMSQWFRGYLWVAQHSWGVGFQPAVTLEYPPEVLTWQLEWLPLKGQIPILHHFFRFQLLNLGTYSLQSTWWATGLWCFNLRLLSKMTAQLGKVTLTRNFILICYLCYKLFKIHLVLVVSLCRFQTGLDCLNLRCSNIIFHVSWFLWMFSIFFRSDCWFSRTSLVAVYVSIGCLLHLSIRLPSMYKATIPQSRRLLNGF